MPRFVRQRPQKQPRATEAPNAQARTDCVSMGIPARAARAEEVGGVCFGFVTKRGERKRPPPLSAPRNSESLASLAQSQPSV